eukprot:UN04342
MSADSYSRNMVEGPKPLFDDSETPVFAKSNKPRIEESIKESPDEEEEDRILILPKSRKEREEEDELVEKLKEAMISGVNPTLVKQEHKLKKSVESAVPGGIFDAIFQQKIKEKKMQKKP